MGSWLVLNWHGGPITSSTQRKMTLAIIQDAFIRGHGTYGSPRVTAELKDNGIPCGKNRVVRLMKSQGIRAKAKRYTGLLTLPVNFTFGMRITYGMFNKN